MSTNTPTHPAWVRHCFSDNYAQARQKFIAAAGKAGARLEHHVLDSGPLGAQGEPLATDVALWGDPDARSLLIVTSGVHGAEGFCGSGCQVAWLEDEPAMSLARRQGVAVLLIHAVNPYGFSHLCRVNEDNIDLNRNFIDFSRLTDNPGYAELHDLLLPETWPPTPDNERAIAQYIAAHGRTAFHQAISTGQSAFPDGLFFSGTAPSWSNRTLRGILRQHGAGRSRIAWIDVHTGLGRFGHGEKIHGGLPGATENLRDTRAIWGADVVAAWEGESASRQVVGHAIGALFDECPQAHGVGIAMEYGTRHDADFNVLRAGHWLRRYPGRSTPEQQAQIRQTQFEASYVNDDEWHGMITGQFRTAVIQACLGLGR